MTSNMVPSIIDEHGTRTHKACRGCGRMLEVGQFYNQRGILSARCKPCKSTADKANTAARSRAMIALTARQQEVFAFVAEYITTNKIAPTRREIAAGVGQEAVVALAKHLQKTCDILVSDEVERIIRTLKKLGPPVGPANE